MSPFKGMETGMETQIFINWNPGHSEHHIMKLSKITLVIMIVTISYLFPATLGQDSGVFIDLRDSTDYKWIKLGEQVWMAENLSYLSDTGSWCYDNKESHCITYGRLYDWETAKKEGGKLKETGVEYWLPPNRGATNETGFSALPGGFRFDNKNYNRMGFNAYFWTSSVFLHTVDGAWSRSLHHNRSGINRFGNIISYGFSVRCLKD